MRKIGRFLIWLSRKLDPPTVFKGSGEWQKPTLFMIGEIPITSHGAGGAGYLGKSMGSGGGGGVQEQRMTKWAG